MKLKFKSSQFKTLAEFFNDVAKGLVLAAILGQGVLTKFAGASRALNSLFWAVGSLTFLFFGVLLSREVKS